MKEEYEHSKAIRHGTKELVTHLTGKRREVKTKALEKKGMAKRMDMKNAMNWKDKDRRKAFKIVGEAHKRGEL